MIKQMAGLVVGRSEGVAYPNNNLTYRQFEIKDEVMFIKHICSTCKYEKFLKINSPCNLCNLNPEREDNWKAKS